MRVLGDQVDLDGLVADAVEEGRLVQVVQGAPTKAGKRPLFDIHALFTGPALARMAVAAPMLALVIGMGGVYQYEEQQRVAAMAEIDCTVLGVDNLPGAVPLEAAELPEPDGT